MEKFAKFLLAILGFAIPVLFILYLLISSVRPENTGLAEFIGIMLGVGTIVGVIIFGKQNGTLPCFFVVEKFTFFRDRDNW